MKLYLISIDRARHAALGNKPEPVTLGIVCGETLKELIDGHAARKPYCKYYIEGEEVNTVQIAMFARGLKPGDMRHNTSKLFVAIEHDPKDDFENRFNETITNVYGDF